MAGGCSKARMSLLVPKRIRFALAPAPAGTAFRPMVNGKHKYRMTLPEGIEDGDTLLIGYTIPGEQTHRILDVQMHENGKDATVTFELLPCG